MNSCSDDIKLVSQTETFPIVFLKGLSTVYKVLIVNSFQEFYHLISRYPELSMATENKVVNLTEKINGLFIRDGDTIEYEMLTRIVEHFKEYKVLGRKINIDLGEVARTIIPEISALDLENADKVVKYILKEIDNQGR